MLRFGSENQLTYDSSSVPVMRLKPVVFHFIYCTCTRSQQFHAFCPWALVWDCLSCGVLGEMKVLQTNVHTQPNKRVLWQAFSHKLHSIWNRVEKYSCYCVIGRFLLYHTGWETVWKISFNMCIFHTAEAYVASDRSLWFGTQKYCRISLSLWGWPKDGVCVCTHAIP